MLDRSSFNDNSQHQVPTRPSAYFHVLGIDWRAAVVCSFLDPNYLIKSDMKDVHVMLVQLFLFPFFLRSFPHLTEAQQVGNSIDRTCYPVVDRYNMTSFPESWPTVSSEAFTGNDGELIHLHISAEKYYLDLMLWRSHIFKKLLYFLIFHKPLYLSLRHWRWTNIWMVDQHFFQENNMRICQYCFVWKKQQTIGVLRGGIAVCRDSLSFSFTVFTHILSPYWPFLITKIIVSFHFSDCPLLSSWFLFRSVHRTTHSILMKILVGNFRAVIRLIRFNHCK